MHKYLRREELHRVLTATERFRDHLLLRLIYTCGLRVSEAHNANVGDVHLEDGLFVVTRAKWHPEGRVVPLWDEVTNAMLKTHILNKTSESPLFSSRNGDTIGKGGKRLSIRQMQRIYEKAAEKAGLGKPWRHIHVLRHTHAVMSIRQGIDIRTLQQNMGHTCLDNTAVYLTMTIDDRKSEYRNKRLPI